MSLWFILTDLETVWEDRLQVKVKVNDEVIIDAGYTFSVQVGDTITLSATVMEIAGGIWPSITWEKVDGESVTEQQGTKVVEKTFSTEGVYTYMVKSQVCQEESEEYMITVEVTGLFVRIHFTILNGILGSIGSKFCKVAR